MDMVTAAVCNMQCKSKANGLFFKNMPEPSHHINWYDVRSSLGGKNDMIYDVLVCIRICIHDMPFNGYTMYTNGIDEWLNFFCEGAVLTAPSQNGMTYYTFVTPLINCLDYKIYKIKKCCHFWSYSDTT